jgi:hypothetical protein
MPMDGGTASFLWTGEASMRQPSARPILNRIIAAAILSTACVAGASAEDARIKKMKLDITVLSGAINITSSDGTRWDTILPDNVTINAHMVLDTRWPGYVERVGLFLGHCNDSLCGAFPKLFFEAPFVRDYDRNVAIAFSASMLPVSNGGIPVVPYGDEILRTCNEHLQPDGATKAFSFGKQLTASFSANTRKAVSKDYMFPLEVGEGFDGGDTTTHDEFFVQVNCIPAPVHATEPPPRRHNVKVEDITLFLTTYSGAGSSGHTPSAAQCKPLKVTTRIATDKEGPVKVKLWRKIDNGPVTEEIRTLDAQALGNGDFGADWDKWEHFGKTTYAQYMAEIIGGTFAPSTPWKDITIHCAGNFADVPRGDGPINIPEPTRPGFVADPPRLSCAGGTLKGNDCVCPRGTKEVKAGANAFRCVANVSEPTPPKISCAGGVLKGNDCMCPRGTREIKAGANAYRCLPVATAPTQVTPPAVRHKLVAPPRGRTTGATTGQRVIR